jgi:hypothetical protein
MLPFAVAILFVLPVLRGGGTASGQPAGQPVGIAGTAMYLFLAWAAAVLATFILSRRLARHDGGSAPDTGPGGAADDRHGPGSPEESGTVAGSRHAKAQKNGQGLTSGPPDTPPPGTPPADTPPADGPAGGGTIDGKAT